MSYTNIPLCWPFKMVPNRSDYGIHMDDAWAHEQFKSYDRRVFYRQKWEKADTTDLIVESSIAPGDLILRRPDYTVEKTFVWSVAFDATSYKIYKLTYDVSDVPNGVYFLTMKSAEENAVGFVSEPIHIMSKWPDTLLYTFKNSFNRDGVAWTTGVLLKFRCESGISLYTPERDRTAYVDQLVDVKTLFSTPSRTFKLLIGKATGVPYYILDILNRIFCCDYVSINGKQFETPIGSKWEKTEVKGYPMIGAAIDIVPAKNTQVLQEGLDVPLGGFVTTYQIETGWFGTSEDASVIEVEENN